MQKIPKIPSTLFIEMNNSCNLRCKMCSMEHMKRPIQYMDLALCRKIIDNAAALKIPWVRLHFYGEPLLDKRLIETIRYAKEQGILKVWITTNGTLLSEQLAKSLIESGLDDISFSVTGASQEVYEGFQGYNSSIKLDQVEESIEKFIKIRDRWQRDKPRVTLQYIFDGSNFRDFVLYHSKWYSKAEKVNFTNLGTTTEKKDEIVRFDKVPCEMLFSMLAILSNGEVTVCCGDLNGDYSLGNINEHPIEYFWNSPKLAELREKHIKGEFESLALCRKCDSIVDGYFIGDVLEDLHLKAAAYSVINKLEKQKGNIVLYGADVISKFILLNKSLYDKTALVIDNYKTGVIRGKTISKIDSLRKLDSGTIIITSNNSFEAEDICYLITKMGLKHRFRIMRIDEELNRLERIKRDLGAKIDMNSETVFKFLKSIKNKKIIVFGTGQAGVDLFESFPFGIAYYVDNNSQKWGKDFMGFEVKDPINLEAENKDDIAIFIASIYYKEISQQLIEMGFEENRHFWNGLKILKEDVVSPNSWSQKYNVYREKYNIHPSVLFNGEGILLYGDGDIQMGKYSYIGRFSSVQAHEQCKVIIGKGCRISHFVKIYTSNVKADQDFSSGNLLTSTGDVIIGDYCWIGAGVFIKEGVKIGENAVIGANSVVTKDIPSYAIAGGVPAKVIKYKACKE